MKAHRPHMGAAVYTVWSWQGGNRAQYQCATADLEYGAAERLFEVTYECINKHYQTADIEMWLPMKITSSSSHANWYSADGVIGERGQIHCDAVKQLFFAAALAAVSITDAGILAPGLEYDWVLSGYGSFTNLLGAGYSSLNRKLYKYIAEGGACLSLTARSFAPAQYQYLWRSCNDTLTATLCSSRV